MAGARSFFDDGATAAICGRCAYAYVRRGFRGAAASAVNGSSPGWVCLPRAAPESFLGSCEGSWPAQRTDTGGRAEAGGEAARAPRCGEKSVC